MFYFDYIYDDVPLLAVSYPQPNKSIYLNVGYDTFFSLGNKTFESFEFKLNKRGGESGKIKFSKMFGSYKIGDSVTLIVEGKKVFRGVIEKIANEGLEVLVIPLWGRLDYVFITDTLAYEETESIKKIITNKVFIEKMTSVGIGVNIKNIEIPIEYKITTTLAGRSIRDILDELEGGLPNNYCYGVDSSGEFYFKPINENKQKKLNWHKGHFSNSEIDKDYSNLFSQYVVKMKDNKMNAFNVLKQIVGDDEAYPATPFTNIVGKKTGVFELSFMADASAALDYAYQNLKSQAPAEKLKLTNINYKTVDINSNEAIEVILKPIQNFYEDFNINFSTSPVIAGGVFSGILQKIGQIIGTSRSALQDNGVLDFNKQSEYINACDRSLKINKVIVYYISARSVDKFKITDGKKEIIALGGGGVLEFDADGFEKRSLKVAILNLKDTVLFYKMRCYFEQGSQKVLMNVREITYKYSKGLLTVDSMLAKLNAVLTGVIYNRELKIKELEKLLTNSK